MFKTNTDNHFQISKPLQQINQSFDELSKGIPSFIFLNSSINFEFLAIDFKLKEHATSFTNANQENILKEFISEKCLEKVSNKYLKYLDTNEFQKPLSFIQKIDNIKTCKSELYYIRGKVIENRKIVSIAIPLQGMNLFNHDGDKLYQNSVFINKNFEKYNTITKTELLVCKYLCKGLSLKKISLLLQKSEHTIKNHKNNLYKKMEVTNFFDFYNFSHKFKINTL